MTYRTLIIAAYIILPATLNAQRASTTGTPTHASDAKSSPKALNAAIAFSGTDQVSDPLPEGLKVRLEAPDGKTDYLMGEPIVLRLIFSSDRPGYEVNMTRMFGPSETVNVTPADAVFRWHGIDTSDTITLTPVSSSGISKSVWVNNSIIIKRPGTYSVSVTTGVARNGTWLTVTSTAMTIILSPMSDSEEAKRLASLSETIAKTDHSDGLDHRAEVRLACLEEDQAARKKVELYLGGRDDITGIRKTGLALSKNIDLELKLLDDAWRAVDRVPDQHLLDQMILLRHLAAGIPVRGWTMLVPGETMDEVIRAQAETAPYIKEIVATIPQRHGANKTATRAFLDGFKKHNDSDLNYSQLQPNQ